MGHTPLLGRLGGPKAPPSLPSRTMRETRMRRTLLLAVLLALNGVVGLSHAPDLAAQSPTPRIDEIRFSTIGEWQSGTRDHLLVSNNDDGELRLVENQPEGIFS